LGNGGAIGKGPSFPLFEGSSREILVVTIKKGCEGDLLEQEGKTQLTFFLRKGDLLEMLLYENAEIDNARHEK